jgi:hypothetical protein
MIHVPLCTSLCYCAGRVTWFKKYLNIMEGLHIAYHYWGGGGRIVIASPTNAYAEQQGPLRAMPNQN